MLSERIKAKAVELGYAACGIIPSAAFDEYASEIDKRSKLFPEAKGFYDIFKGMATPPEGSESIVVCTHRINRFKIPENSERFYGKMYLFDNRVDYTEEHRANIEFEIFLKLLGMKIIDGTVPDRWAGARAGLGKFGRNNFLYDKNHGSYIIINTWIVDKILDYDPVPENMSLSACDDNCHKCIEACPTNALSDKFLMNAGRCICRVQFDGDDALTDEMKEQMGIWLYGCDACQDVCPMNKGKFTESNDYPLLSDFEELMKPENILNMDEDTYKNILHPRFWYAGEESLWLWKCNALRVMINSGDSKYHFMIKQSCEHTDDRISGIAKWGCKKLAIF